MSEAAMLRQQVSRLRVGERLTISGKTIEDAFPGHQWDGLMAAGDAVDKLVTGIVGAAWRLRTWRDDMTGAVTFARVKEDGRRWFIDPDRRHMFCQELDGSWRQLPGYGGRG